MEPSTSEIQRLQDHVASVGKQLIRHFESFLTEIETFAHMHRATVAALDSLLYNVKRGKLPPLPPDAGKILSNVQDSDFLHVRRMYVAFLWGHLEAFTGDFQVEWLRRCPGMLKSKELRKIKISFTDFMEMSADERLRYVIEHTSDVISVQNRNGIERFLLEYRLLGLEVSLDSGTTRDLIEMQHVRNLIMHRRGVVDRKFSDACPWLKVQPRQDFKINQDDVSRYSSACLKYAKSVLSSVGKGITDYTAKEFGGRASIEFSEIQKILVSD